MASPPTASPPFPPTSKEFFIYKPKGGTWDGEDHADGYVMEFRVTGQDFKIGIDLPKEAEHGPYMIIFYASFFHNDATHSLVETGLSFSGIHHGWNFPAAALTPDGKKTDPHNHLMSGDITKVGHFDLRVSFKPEAHGGLIKCSLNGIPNSFWVPKHQNPNKMRLVIATGDRRGAFFSEAGMTLEAIDGKPPKVSGHVKWQRGHKIADGDRRSVLKSATPFGVRCSLPPEKKPVSAKHPSDPKPETDTLGYGSARPLSQSEVRRLQMMQ